MTWALVALAALLVAEGWYLRRLLVGLVAQVAVLTVVVHEVLDKVVELDAELHAVDEGLK